MFGEDDLEGFFDEYADDATLQASAGGDPITLKVIISKSQAEATAGYRANAEEITGEIITSKAPSVKRGDTLTVGSDTWYIKHPFNDGTGITKLSLSRDRI